MIDLMVCSDPAECQNGPPFSLLPEHEVTRPASPCFPAYPGQVDVSIYFLFYKADIGSSAFLSISRLFASIVISISSITFHRIFPMDGQGTGL